MEVEFADEVGSGLGPTLEFYSLVSQEWQRRDLNMWREGSAEASTRYITAKRGLFPAPVDWANLEENDRQTLLLRFRMLGRFVAKSLFDFRLIDIRLNSAFLRRVVFDEPLDETWSMRSTEKSKQRLIILKTHIEILAAVDAGLAWSLKELFTFVELKHQEDDGSKDKIDAIRHPVHGNQLEDMALDFTLPGYPIPLIKNGEEQSVTIWNVEEYIERVLDMSLYHGIEHQVGAFRSGFSDVFAIQDLRCLTCEELQSILSSGQWEGPWQRQGIVIL